MGRVRTNIEIEDAYVEAIMDRFGVHTKTEAVDLALRHLAGQPMTREEALAMRRARRPRGARDRCAPERCRTDGRGVILADSSAWVEYDRATGSPVDRRLAELVTTGGPVAVTEPVIMEVVAGARSSEREADLRRLLRRFELLRFDAAVDFESAARIYRACRRGRITPRGMVDCMIASVAYRHGVALLAFDADLAHVARVMGIEMDDASLQS